MPRHDPVPERSDRPPAAPAPLWLRFRKMMGWMALAALVAVLLALIYLKISVETVTLHMQIATILGVGLSMLVGTALMGLVFLSSRSGHDVNATFGEWNDDGHDSRG